MILCYTPDVQVNVKPKLNVQNQFSKPSSDSWSRIRKRITFEKEEYVVKRWRIDISYNSGIKLILWPHRFNKTLKKNVST